MKNESVTIGLVYDLLASQIISVWEKLESIILEQRKREFNPAIYPAFESLYLAIKKYQQQGPPLKDDVRVHKFED